MTIDERNDPPRFEPEPSKPATTQSKEHPFRISVVTPTLRRPDEVRGLIESLHSLCTLPAELILVDGAPPDDQRTAEVVAGLSRTSRFPIRYLRSGGGTAIQRNAGIDASVGNLIAFVDDDIRMEPTFFDEMLDVFTDDAETSIAAATGVLTNQRLDAGTSRRWQWYRRLRLFTTWEPGRYDYQSGYPINRYLQPEHEDIRDLDFASSNCAVWRADVLRGGLRFDEFFRDFGVLEDAHLSLRARRDHRVVEVGRARAVHLDSPRGREDSRLVAWKTAVNYRFVFVDIVPNRTARNELRFWRVQAVDLARLVAAFAARPSPTTWAWVTGKATGIAAATRIRTAIDGRQLVQARRTGTAPDRTPV